MKQGLAVMGFRLADMPLLVKIAFAPTVALIALAGVAWVSINAQKESAQDLRNGLHLYSAPHLFAALHARNNTRLSQDREVT